MLDPSAKLATARLLDAATASDSLGGAGQGSDPEKQAIVGATRVTDAIEIDDARLDEPTKLEKVMPIATVPGEPGGVETQDRADLAGAQPRDEFFKPRPGDGAACRATEVVVNDFDIAEATPAGLVDKFILTPLALEMDLDLSLR